jgi:translation initiation factor IF-2
MEELQPQELAAYTPANAPVPSGEIVIERGSTSQEMAPLLNRSAADVVRFLLQQGEMMTATQSLTDEMIELFAVEVGATVRIVDPGAEQEEALQKILGLDTMADADDGGEIRSPVITVMGHVDHGKTLLLDRIRNANVIAGEAGGITQHIGAYRVEHEGKFLTFIDTPGHEAFTAMRARGAEATDIVVLVVAADDGVMPQTAEAIDHAKAAEVPIVVAINKIDRPGADVNRVLAQLAEKGLVPESYGGDTITVELSALQNLGIDDLLEQLVVVAELEELRAVPDGRASGVVLESHLDKGRGPVATVLVQRGELRVGQPVVAGAAWGRIRAMINDRGEQVKSAGPSTPVEILGLSDVASSGAAFIVAQDEKTAAKVADTREHWQRQASFANAAAAASSGAKLEDLFQQIQAGEAATLNLIIKTDMHGSLEAVTESLKKLERDEVKLGFVSRGVGGITENDVQLAGASNATILGFNVRADRKGRSLADELGVEIRHYEIIYKLLEDIENAMVGMLDPEFEEVITGDAEVREVFKVPRIGAIAGCYVLNGSIRRNSKVRFLRDGNILWRGTVSSLRRFTEDVREVATGYECGIGLSDFQDLRPGDIIETFEDREIPRV